ncbi:MAG: hypothetical protein RIC12_00880 [Pirellulales bacterium]
MTIAAPEKVNAKPANQHGSSTVASLVKRLSAEVDAAIDRVHMIQAEAAKAYVGEEASLTQFITVADRIHEILLPRLQAFATLPVFENVSQTVALEPRVPKGRGFDGRTTTISVPYSDECPARMELTFRVGHDRSMKHAIVDYQLKILPVLIAFDDQDNLVIQLKAPNEDAISAWINDRLVDFTRIYFEVYFDDEYQKKSLELDPVMNIRFPRALSVGTREFRSHTYYFFTEDSIRLFDNNAAEYVEMESCPPDSSATRSPPP